MRWISGTGRWLKCFESTYDFHFLNFHAHLKAQRDAFPLFKLFVFIEIFIFSRVSFLHKSLNDISSNQILFNISNMTCPWNLQISISFCTTLTTSLLQKWISRGNLYLKCTMNLTGNSAPNLALTQISYDVSLNCISVPWAACSIGSRFARFGLKDLNYFLSSYLEGFAQMKLPK